MGDWDGGVFWGGPISVGPQRGRLPGGGGQHGRGHRVLHGQRGIPSTCGRRYGAVAAVEVGGVYRVVGRIWREGGSESIGGEGVQICGGGVVAGGGLRARDVVVAAVVVVVVVVVVRVWLLLVLWW